MTDREMFEAWFTENIDDDVEFDKYDNSDNSPYFDGLVNATWKAWQASANREGYKLVPIEPEQEIIKEMCKVWFESNCAHIMKTKTANILYKSMIGAAP